MLVLAQHTIAHFRYSRTLLLRSRSLYFSHFFIENTKYFFAVAGSKDEKTCVFIFNIFFGVLFGM
jgi:hypothetical protein